MVDPGPWLPSPPAPGWYPDPTGPVGVIRYWSGSAWTEHTSVAPAAMSLPPSPPPPLAPGTWQATLPPPPQYMLRPQVTRVQLEDSTRRALTFETVFVMVAFLLPVVTAAVVTFAQHVSGVGPLTRFPVLVQNPLENLFLDMVAYVPVAAMAPLALFLLARTGQTPDVLGLEPPGLRSDIIPAVGIGAASFGCEIAVLIPLAPLLTAQSRLSNSSPVGNVPHYYVALALLMSLVTAVAEEVLMNGYLMTRLGQLGWSPGHALILGIALRTSYHVYYGIGFLATIPFAYFVTRSFQKHGRLTRPITAHFFFDAVLTTVAVLA